jgi:hypothetical protein
MPVTKYAVTAGKLNNFAILVKSKPTSKAIESESSIREVFIFLRPFTNNIFMRF